MSMVNPIKQTTNREEIEAKLDHLYDREGVINRKFTEKPSIHDLIYDELRNLNGALASLSAGNEIFLKAIVDNTATTADRLGSVDERLCEANGLLTDVRNSGVIDRNMTQDDIDSMVEHWNTYENGDTMKKVEFSKDERHILYRALGSRASTMRNQLGYTRVDNDGNLKDQIAKCEKLIQKIKNS